MQSAETTEDKQHAVAECNMVAQIGSFSCYRQMTVCSEACSTCRLVVSWSAAVACLTAVSIICVLVPN